jgi:hypothetical protein
MMSIMLMDQRLQELLKDTSIFATDILLAAFDHNPYALRRKDHNGNPLIHIECKNQCRSAVIRKCIELYPESLGIAGEDESLPLHLLLCNPLSTEEVAMMMIHFYLIALLWKNDSNLLPIHIECMNQCRYSMIIRFIELCPALLYIANDGKTWQCRQQRLGWLADCYLPIHLMLKNLKESTNVVLQFIQNHPHYLRCKSTQLGYLPLHVECMYRCRPAIISRCIELHPEALAQESENGCFPIHLLLDNLESSVDLALQMINAYPAAVKVQSKTSPLLYSDDMRICRRIVYENNDELPIHIECKNQCRPAIISKLIELYPASLVVKNRNGALPVHLLLQNPRSSLTLALGLIDICPETLQCKVSGPLLKRLPLKLMLPIHVESASQCRWPLLCKFIEFYPESLSNSDVYENLPLHLILSNASATAIEIPCRLIEKYPASVYHRNKDGDLPIHIECKNQCRPILISKLIALYPASISIRNSADLMIPRMITLARVNPSNVHRRAESFCLLSSSDPPEDRLVIDLPSMQDPCRRVILNSIPTSILFSTQLLLCHDLNWQARSPLLHLFLQIITRRNRLPKTTSFESLLQVASSSRQLSTRDQAMRMMTMRMIYESSLLCMHGGLHVTCYDIDLGESIGDLMLRFVISYL